LVLFINFPPQKCRAFGLATRVGGSYGWSAVLRSGLSDCTATLSVCNKPTFILTVKRPSLVCVYCRVDVELLMLFNVPRWILIH